MKSFSEIRRTLYEFNGVGVEPTLSELDENKVRWKKAGNDGEIETTINGKRYKIEKAYDSNIRHRGEYKIMVWDKRSEDWEWDNTVQSKSYAKELVISKLDEAVDADDTGGEEETDMAMGQIQQIRHFLDGIEEMVKADGDMEEWVQNKLTKATDYLKTIYSYKTGKK